ncbi:MAG: hypothetical protein ACRCZF_11195, partial [Gemmataceae bacterium]
MSTAMPVETPVLPDTAPNDPVVIPPPIEEQFWRKYNEQYEFPIGWAITVLIYVATIAAYLFIIEGGWKKKNPPPVPIMALDGDDDSGMGMAGSGGDPNPLAVGEAPKADIERLQLPTPLENVKEDLNKKLQMEDPTSALQIPDAAAAALGALDQTLQEKILGIGQKKGNGPGAGSGDGASGTGNG